MNPTAYLLLGVEQYLRELPDDEFDELVQRTRPPGDKRPADHSQSAFVNSLFGGGDD